MLLQVMEAGTAMAAMAMLVVRATVLSGVWRSPPTAVPAARAPSVQTRRFECRPRYFPFLLTPYFIRTDTNRAMGEGVLRARPFFW